ncbi:hypothetical protein BS47DRAFT_1376118 [Hydnum rufescens UP504]|uniref:F-box domain-containing protein n=1 Tax=Hydnum rufescens UP504 TaxID=1448309 RepID=A0A9P6B1Q7_9AGAM|nr:hypothetical protein BS47DRAFT_1376118 [Hydnum rufescens UP504]
MSGLSRASVIMDHMSKGVRKNTPKTVKTIKSGLDKLFSTKATTSKTPSTPNKLWSLPSRRVLPAPPTTSPTMNTPPQTPRLSDPFSLIEAPDISTPPALYFPHAPLKKRPLLPRIWDAVLSTPSSKKGKGRLLGPTLDANGSPLPLDGEEGELIEDEGCFDVVAGPSFAPPGKIDFIASLPPEVALHILRHLDLSAVLVSLTVSRYWNRLASDKLVWRDLFYQQSRWKVNNLLASRPRISSRSSSMIASRSSLYGRWARNSLLSIQSRDVPVPDLSLDWLQMYKNRLQLDCRWASAEPKATRLSGHGDSVYCVEFDHDKIITGSRDKQIKVWSLATGKVLATLRGHEGSVLCLAFESRSGFMVSGSSDRRVLVWDLNALRSEGIRPRAVLEGHAGGVLDLRIDAQWIVSCSKDATVRVWSRATLEHMYTLKGHHGPVNAVGLDAGLIVSASGDGTMILWDVARGARKARVRTFAGHERGLACVDFHGDVVTLTGHTALVRALSFDERMERLVSTSYDKTVIVWEIKPRSVEEGGGARAKQLRQFSGHHESHIFDVNFDATRIISSSQDRKIAVLDFGTDLDTSLFI